MSWFNQHRGGGYGWNSGGGSHGSAQNLYSFRCTMGASITPEVGNAGTLTRASTANYASSAILMAQKSSGNATVPAYIFGLDTTKGGVQISGPRQNLYTQSQNLAHANWTAYLTPTRTANTTDVLAPDGTNTATKFLNNAADEGCNQTAMAVAASGRKLVQSVWARCATGVEAILYLGCDTTTSQGYTSVAWTLTDQWQRCYFYKAYGSVTGNIRPAFYCHSASVAYYLWGAQVEMVDDATYGSNIQFPSAYIPTTTAAVATAGDVLSYPAENIAGCLTTGKITVWVAPAYSQAFVSSSKDKYIVSMADNITIRLASGAIEATYGGATLTASSQTWDANEFFRLTFGWSGQNLILLKNGVSIASTGASGASVPTASAVLIGSDGTTEEYFDGIIAGVQFKPSYPDAATDLAEFGAEKLEYGYKPVDPSALSYTRTSFTEAAGNTGAITETSTVAVINDTFVSSPSTYQQGIHYTCTGVPSGLSPSVVYASPTTVTFSFTGNALAHTPGDSVTDVSLTFLSGAFTSGVAPSDTVEALSITFIGTTPTVTYSASVFNEAAANDGSITETITGTLVNDTFVAGPFVANTHYTVTGVPSGLTFVVTRTSASIATFSFTGNASSHAFANSISNLVFTWLGAAFTGAAIPTDGSQTKTYSVSFLNPTAAGGSINLRGTTYTINAHPRIWYTADRNTALIARSVTTNYVWNTLKARCDGQLANVATNYNTFDALNFAVAYYGTNKVTTTYRDAAITILMNYASVVPSYSGAYDYASIDLMYIAMVYDWMYADMTAQQRSDVRDYVHDDLLPFLYTHPANHHAPASWAPPSHNLNITKVCGEIMWCMAAMDDDTTRANPLMQYNYDHWIDKLWGTASFAGGDVEAAGGRTWSGSHYGPSRVMQWWSYVCDALDTSLATMTGFRTPVRNYLSYFLHSMLPPETTYMHAEFEPGAIIVRDQGSRLTQTLLPMVLKYAGQTDSQYIQYWLVNKFFPQLIASNYIGLWHLWYDPATSAADYSAAPLSYSTSGTSVGFSRTAWNTATSSFLSFSCADYVGDHQVQTVGSYKIFRNGEFVLIEHAPRYASGNPSGSSADPSYCNIYVAGSGLVSGVQTGGQYLRTPGSGTASIDKRTEGTSFCYMRGNMTGAYSSSAFPHTYIHRNVCHFRASSPSVKDFFVFMDVVNSTNSITKAEQMYVPAAPTISSNQASFTLTNNKCIIEKVLPSGATLSQVAVTDRATHTDVPQSASDTPTKLLISDSAGNYAAFLWVIHTGATSTTMPTLTAVSGASGQLIGVLIDDNPSRIYLGSKDNQTHSATFTVTASPTNTCQWVISGLVAGDKYDKTGSNPTYTFTKSGTGAITVDANGVLTV